MPSLPLRLSALLLALGLSACDDAPKFTQAEPGEARSGGGTTVRIAAQQPGIDRGGRLHLVKQLPMNLVDGGKGRAAGPHDIEDTH